MNLISHEYNILFSVCGGQSTISTAGQSNRVGVMKNEIPPFFIYSLFVVC